ncbi:MAG TPA: DUF6600 domain-containing protein [Thermoanaerobaculia bacterium]|nr:DUF6600 domain-containing protein [Thermoanaerobaculia bacterium]
MRKATLLTLVAIALALPAQAARDKNQSYFSYDDGGTIVRQGEDGREIEGRINMPVFPGDEVITNRRGRAEIRLSDGNIVGVDRASSLLFRSIEASYDGDDEETVAELRYGKVIVHRTADGGDSFRLDTPSATYVAYNEAIFSIDSDTQGKDRIIIFDGTLEVRTPSRTTRLRRGEEARIDHRGLYSLASDGDHGTDDFERWFLKRAERFGGATSRYLDRSLAYYEDDLGQHGSWIHAGNYGWAWRPHVSTGWRPYYYGHWSRSRSGFLTWVSYEPWGWAPYHYGRWSHDPLYGWFWLPGAGYAPAWVYWWYGNGYLGWAPAGWYDCYRPYYDWAYRPYHRAGLNFGFGFYGRVRANDVDLRPWTFVDGNTLVSTRVDRAALTTDVIRGRLLRDHGGFATISNNPARFTRTELKDPAAAINRRAAGSGIGRENGSPADMTPFFRRDPDLAGNVRDRIIRTRPADGTRAAAPAGGSSTGGGSGLAPSGGGGLAPIGGGNVAPISGGALAPIAGQGPESGETAGRIRRATDIPRTDVGTGRVDRGEAPAAERDPRRIDRGSVATPAPAPAGEAPAWRDRVNRTKSSRADEPARTPSAAPERDTTAVRDWRSSVARSAEPRSGTTTEPRASEPRTTAPQRERTSDASRRVIDRIGGARVRPTDSGSSRSTGQKSSPPPARSVDRPSSSSSGKKDSAPPPSRGEGGKIKRDKD